MDWNFSQPISDNVEEAVSGVKGELAVKLFGADLKVLEAKANEIQDVMLKIPRRSRPRHISSSWSAKRESARRPRCGGPLRDQCQRCSGRVETAVGGKAVSQVLVGEQRYDLTVRYQLPFRKTVEDISQYPNPGAVRRTRFSRPTLPNQTGRWCFHNLPRGKLSLHRNQIQRARARPGKHGSSSDRRSAAEGKLPEGYHLDWTGEYESQQRANRRLAIIVPITMLLMSFILYSAFDSWKWVGLILAVVALSPLGGFLSLLITGTHFSVSSGLGFLALIGVSVEIGVIMVEYINQLRTRGINPREAAKEGASLRLRPIMMTMLVATLGLLPAAMSHDIGSDSQRPFAIVIVGGLVVELFVSLMLLPTLYVFWARQTDKLPPPEISFLEEGEHVD